MRAYELTDPYELDCLELIAAAHAQLGDFKKAVEWQNKAVEASPPELLQARIVTLGWYIQKVPDIRLSPHPAWWERFWDPSYFSPPDASHAPFY